MGKANFIYVGPNIPQIGLKKNTLYRGEEPPPRLRDLIVSKPVLRSLFISTKRLAEVQTKLNKKGSMEHTANQEMLAIAKTIPR